MADLKPPRTSGDDGLTLRVLLQYQRESLVRKVSGVADAAAARSPVASGTSLLWLVNHMADAETLWLSTRFGASPAADAAHAPTMAQAIERYRQAWAQTDAVIDGATSLDVPCPAFDDGPPVNLRWILAHLVEETARHAGHADILRELLDGATGR